MNTLQFKLRCWIEKSTNELESVHQEETLSRAISNWSKKGVDLSWKTLWFLSTKFQLAKF